MTAPTQDERREAVRIARVVVEAYPTVNLSLIIDTEQVDLVCRTLLAAQEAFVDRLAPIYAAVMAAFDEHGQIISGRPMLALRDAVFEARKREPT